MAKLECLESNRNMLLLLLIFELLQNNVTKFSNESKQEVKCAEKFHYYFLWRMEVRLKYVTNYSNNERVTTSSTVPDW